MLTPSKRSTSSGIKQQSLDIWLLDNEYEADKFLLSVFALLVGVGVGVWASRGSEADWVLGCNPDSGDMQSMSLTRLFNTSAAEGDEDQLIWMGGMHLMVLW